LIQVASSHGEGQGTGGASAERIARKPSASCNQTANGIDLSFGNQTGRRGIKNRPLWNRASQVINGRTRLACDVVL